jgi:hypothetical protein
MGKGGKGNKSTGRKSIARWLLAGVGLASALGASAAAHAVTDATPRAALEARVMAVRAALQADAEDANPDARNAAPDTRVAQWLNWPNWNNWNNWPNWGNWGNWGNWFNR